MPDMTGLTKNPLEAAETFDKTLEKDTFTNPNIIANEYSNAPYSIIKRWGNAEKKPVLKPKSDGSLIPSA
jgi:hypothetical protein